MMLHIYLLNNTRHFFKIIKQDIFHKHLIELYYNFDGKGCFYVNFQQYICIKIISLCNHYKT